jgi:alkylhydroperoxidase/carboxymuconolactone decarboxylase family protein YurZ
MCVVVALSSLNFPDVIPQVYDHLDTNVLSKLSAEDRFSHVCRLREGLIKSTGIVGAARTGNAMRTLANCVPEHLREKESPRSKESEEVARARGKAFWTRIYSRNKAFDPEASVRASPDYAFVVRGTALFLNQDNSSSLTEVNFLFLEVLYGRIFSFDGVIDDLTTGYAIVAALYGMDCQNQLQHHMKGMLINGATRHDLEDLQNLCLRLANILGVKSRYGKAPIPTLDQ